MDSSSNFSSIAFRSNTSIDLSSILELDQLLNEQGFALWEEILNAFIFPIINLLGIVGCSLSLWIFLKRNLFGDPIFVYYRLLNFIYILILLISIPLGVCFSPKFWPSINTYTCAAYRHFYAASVSPLFHFCSLLDICILLTRVKIFSFFLKKHFSLSPHINSLIFCVASILIHLPLVFIFKIGYVGDFYYFDMTGSLQTNKLYYVVNSEFASSFFGKLIYGFIIIFNTILTLVVGITLNIVSLIQYKSYLKKKYTEFARIEMESNPSHPTNSLEVCDQKTFEERKAENNMFYMAFTLCTISITSRIILALNFSCFILFYSFTNVLIFSVLASTIYILVPTSSLIVFYFFNKKFRHEFRVIFRLRHPIDNNQN